MTKTATAEKAQPGGSPAPEVLDPETAANAPALQTNQSLAVVSDDDFFGDLDTGLENTTAADVSLPRWTILQGLSPQVNPRKDEYVEGAQIGMLYNTATGELAKEKTFVFAAYERRFVEWIPRDQKSACPLRGFPTPVGGGLFMDYGLNYHVDDMGQLRFGPDNETPTQWSENRSLWTPRGNELQETGTWYAIDPDTLATSFIAMAKTQFSSSKKLMSAIRDERPQLARGGVGPARVFYRAWKMTSALKSKSVDGGTNEWFVWSHRPAFRTQDHVNAMALRDLILKIRSDLETNSIVIDVNAGGDHDLGASYTSDDDAKM